MSVASALASACSGDSSHLRGTEIACARAGDAEAFLIPSLLIPPPSVHGATRRRDAGLGSMGFGGVAAISNSDSGRVGGWIGGDLSPAGLESAAEPDAESGRERRGN